MWKYVEIISQRPFREGCWTASWEMASADLGPGILAARILLNPLFTEVATSQVLQGHWWVPGYASRLGVSLATQTVLRRHRCAALGQRGQQGVVRPILGKSDPLAAGDPYENIIDVVDICVACLDQAAPILPAAPRSFSADVGIHALQICHSPQETTIAVGHEITKGDNAQVQPPQFCSSMFLDVLFQICFTPWWK